MLSPGPRTMQKQGGKIRHRQQQIGGNNGSTRSRKLQNHTGCHALSYLTIPSQAAVQSKHQKATARGRLLRFSQSCRRGFPTSLILGCISG